MSTQKKKLGLFLLAIFILTNGVVGTYYYMQLSKPENQKTGEFSQSTEGLHGAKEAQVIELEDGDEFDLEAGYVVKEIGSRKIRMLAYNDSIPGPFIKVKQGGEITIHFTNNTDIETTLHSHGLRLDYQFDGTPMLSQKKIQPGETFTYKLVFPDGGTYWYHPHVREDYAQELGLYGNYISSPTSYNLPPVNEEIHVIVDDILLNDDGTMPPFYKDKTNYAIMGRFGNIMLVNGKTDYERTFQAGEVIRMNITNTANARLFELSIPNAKMKLVGSDLSPYEKEEYVDKILIAPAQRYIIDVYFEEPGIYELRHTSHDNTLGEKVYHMADFIVEDSAPAVSYLQDFTTLHTYENVQNDAASFKEYLFKKPDKRIRFILDPGKLSQLLETTGMSNLPCHRMPNGTWMGACTPEKKTAWLAGLSEDEQALGGEKYHWEDHIKNVNKVATSQDVQWKILDEDTGKTDEMIDTWKFKEGETIKIRVFNDPLSAHPMQHPFHVHGQRMMTIAVNGEEVENKVWQDTILIPVGDTYDIMLELSNPGLWMAHCHIAEHLSSGMMFNLVVGEQFFDHYDDMSIMSM